MMQVVGGVDVPQGSFLGLLLFNIFIYDLKFVVQVSSLHTEALRYDAKAYAVNFKIKALELFLYYDLKKLIHGLAHYSIKLQKKDS